MVAILVVVVVALTALVVLRRRYVVARVWGHSMSPTFHDGERVVATRRRVYRAGDVIVFRPRSASSDVAWRIKRIVAVAGDPVPAWLETGHRVVPAGRVVVVGDNTGHSEDSRQLGYIDLASVAGAVPHRPAPEGS
ncbi:S26 family signal peptidase [Amycolatopsis plumensis]|uniref:Mitochondrial inner membrane protease subunit 2 n=1 Tax=Amycolatopsis plumensis TaxID=236508 RepID=A0ABV5TWP1_9PSEU